MHFFLDFLIGEKELLKAADVMHFNLSLYTELTVDSLLEMSRKTLQ